MKAAILSIGDELILGEIADTNARHIAARLFSLGVRVHEHRTVGDDDTDIAQALVELAAKYDTVIATGGLGPTMDDVTARAAAKATGRRLTLNEEALRHLRGFPVRGETTVIEVNDKQALIPSKATLIPNPQGTACGFIIEHEKRLLFFLPGVPQEMEPMLEQSVLPAVRAGLPRGRTLVTKDIKVFGLSEVQIDSLLKDIPRPEEGITLALCAVFPEIHVKLRAEGRDPALVREFVDQGAARIREKLKECIFSESGETLPEVVARLFRERGKTLALAESCTGGAIAEMITAVPGSSRFFMEGAVTYSNESKHRNLGVPAALTDRHGAVSAEVATAMAEGMLRSARTDVALSVTGIAGPEGGAPDKPVGTVFIGLASPSGTVTKRYLFSGDRQRIRTMTAFMALDWLRRHLLSVA